MAERGLEPFSLDSGVVDYCGLCRKPLQGGRRVLRSGLEYRPLKAEGIENVSLDSSHSCSLMGLKGVVFSSFMRQVSNVRQPNDVIPCSPEVAATRAALGVRVGGHSANSIRSS